MRVDILCVFVCVGHYLVVFWTLHHYDANPVSAIVTLAARNTQTHHSDMFYFSVY